MKRSITIMICLAFVLLAVSAMVATIGAETENAAPTAPTTRLVPVSEYPQFRGDWAGTANCSADGPGTYNQLWSKSFGTYSTPVVKYDQVYLCTNGNIRCYDMDGTSVWTYNSGQSHTSTPLIYGGRCYVAGNDGVLRCLDANATGTGTTTQYWTYTPTDSISGCSGSVLTDGTNLYYTIKSTGDNLQAVKLSDHTEAWSATLGGSTGLEASPSYWNGHIYCGGGDSYSGGVNTLYCYNSTTGTEVWTYATPDSVCSTPAIAYGNVYFAAGDGSMLAVDAVGNGDGTTDLVWDYTVGGGMCCSSPAVGYGCVFIGTEDSTNGWLYCLDAVGNGDGTTNRPWRRACTPAGSFGICSSPVVTPSYVYTTTTGDAVVCINRVAGTVKWTQTIGNGVYGFSASPCIAKGKLFVTSDSGNFYCIGPINDVIPPTVFQTLPADQAVDIDETFSPTVTFSEAMDQTTIDETTITFETTSGPISGSIDYNIGNFKATFTPDADLPKGEVITGTVLTGCKDTFGNNLDGDDSGTYDGPTDTYTWQFTIVPPDMPVVNFDSVMCVEDQEMRVNLSLWVYDADTDYLDLTITEDSDYCSIDVYDLVCLYPDGISEEIVNLTVMDDTYTVYKDLDVTIDASNDAPWLDDLDPISPTEEIDYVLDLTDKVHDIDSTGLALKTNSSYATVNGLNITFNYPEGVLYELVKVTVRDGIAENSTDLQVNVIPVNDAPVIDDLFGRSDMYANITVYEDTMFNFTLNMSDIDGPEPTIVLIDAPDGMTVDQDNGWIYYLPTQEDVGNISFTVEVRDPNTPALKDSIEVNLVVMNTNDAPVAEPITLVSGGVENLTVVLDTTEATDVDGDELVYLWAFGDGGSEEGPLEVTHTYPIAGTYNVTLTVSDGIEVSLVYLVIDVTAPSPITTDGGDGGTGDGGDGGDGGGPDTNITDPNATTGGNGTGSSDEGLPMMAIAGVSIALIVIVLLIIIVVIIVVVVMVTKKKPKDEPAPPPAEGAEAQVEGGPVEGGPVGPGETPAQDPYAATPSQDMYTATPSTEPASEMSQGQIYDQAQPADQAMGLDGQSETPELQAAPETAEGEAPVGMTCPTCGQPGQFYEEYNAYWCMTCQKYL